MIVCYIIRPLIFLGSLCVNQSSEIAGIETMRQAVGGWVVVDPTHQWTLNAESIKSSGKNTPFLGAVLTGKVGEVVV